MPDDTQVDPNRTIAALRQELVARTAERDEALAQQAAISEVLQITNASAGDLAPVFDAILEKAHALCEAPLGSLVLYDSVRLRAVATRGYPQEYDALARGFLSDRRVHATTERRTFRSARRLAGGRSGR